MEWDDRRALPTGELLAQLRNESFLLVQLRGQHQDMLRHRFNGRLQRDCAMTGISARGREFCFESPDPTFVRYSGEASAIALSYSFPEGCQDGGRPVCSRPADIGFRREVAHRESAISLHRVSFKQPCHCLTQGKLSRGADRFHGFSASKGAISRSLRSLSLMRASRCSAGKRLLASSVSASAMEACHGGRC